MCQSRSAEHECHNDIATSFRYAMQLIDCKLSMQVARSHCYILSLWMRRLCIHVRLILRIFSLHCLVTIISAWFHWGCAIILHHQVSWSLHHAGNINANGWAWHRRSLLIARQIENKIVSHYLCIPPGSARSLQFPGVVHSACPPASCTQLQKRAHVTSLLLPIHKLHGGIFNEHPPPSFIA